MVAVIRVIRRNTSISDSEHTARFGDNECTTLSLPAENVRDHVRRRRVEVVGPPELVDRLLDEQLMEPPDATPEGEVSGD